MSWISYKKTLNEGMANEFHFIFQLQSIGNGGLAPSNEMNYEGARGSMI